MKTHSGKENTLLLDFYLLRQITTLKSYWNIYFSLIIMFIIYLITSFAIHFVKNLFFLF